MVGCECSGGLLHGSHSLPFFSLPIPPFSLLPLFFSRCVHCCINKERRAWCRRPFGVSALRLKAQGGGVFPPGALRGPLREARCAGKMRTSLLAVPPNAGTLGLCWTRKPPACVPQCTDSNGRTERSTRLFGPPNVRAPLGNASGRAARERFWARSAPPGTSTSRSTDVVSCRGNSETEGARVCGGPNRPLRGSVRSTTRAGALATPRHRPRALLGALRTAGDVDGARSTDTTLRFS